MRCRTASKPAWSCIPSHRAARAVGRVCAAPSSHAAATPTSTSGHGWLPPLQWPVAGGEAMDSADGLIEAAEATGNPYLLAWALGAYGAAFRDADPVGALNALGRGLVIAQDSGNRSHASVLAVFLARLEAEHGDTVSAFDHLTLAIRNYHNCGQHHDDPRPAGQSSPLFSTGSDATNRRPPSPASPSVPSPQRRSPKSPPRSPTCARSSATRPTNRSPARVRR